MIQFLLTRLTRNEIRGFEKFTQVNYNRFDQRCNALKPLKSQLIVRWLLSRVIPDT